MQSKHAQGAFFRFGLVAAVAATVISASPAFAQQAPASGQQELRADNNRWSLALGTDPYNFNLSTREPGVKAQALGTLARDFRPAARIGFRAQLFAGKDFPRGMRFIGTNCPTGTEPGCEANLSRSFAALTGAAVYRLRPNGSIRPYVVGGPGVYVERTGVSPKSGFLAPPAGGMEGSRTEWSVGAMGGAGIGFHVGKSELFVEQAIHFRKFISGEHYSPLTFGFHF